MEPEHLAALETVSIRNVFSDEETEFTPWLADHIERLETPDLLNVSLEVVDTEVSVGSRSADIVARIPDEDRTVIIENQFDRTDLDHLSRSLVYAAGKEADVVVWIAESFKDECVSVFHWLNEQTDGEAAFFAIEVSLRQIADSPYALEFTAVERPDEWTTVMSRTTDSKTERTQLDFWHQFRTHAEEHGYAEYASRSPRGTASYSISTGYGDIIFYPTIRFSDDMVFMKVRFTDDETTFASLDEDTFLQAFENAVASLDLTGTGFAADRIQWDRADENEIYDHLYLYYPENEGVDLSKRDEWSEYHTWLLEATQLFQDTLDQVIP